MSDFAKAFESLSFPDKLNLARRVGSSCGCALLSQGVSDLVWYGYLTTVLDKRVHENSGEHYVYVWRHCWGDPFYVGMGKGDRWTSRGGRCDEFYYHLDAGDAVVYMLLDGVDSKTAHEYERYVSGSLSLAGYELANRDNNTRTKSEQEIKRMMERCRESAGKDLTPRVEKAVLNIIQHKVSVADYRVTDKFLRNYGSDYFSRNYIKSEEAPA